MVVVVLLACVVCSYGRQCGYCEHGKLCRLWWLLGGSARILQACSDESVKWRGKETTVKWCEMCNDVNMKMKLKWNRLKWENVV